jgi:hypothetical protein
MKNTISLLIILTFISCQKSKKDTIIAGIEECNRVEFYRISEKQKHLIWNDTVNNKEIARGILIDNEQINFDDPKIIGVLNNDYTKYSVNKDSCDDILEQFNGWKIPEITIYDQACAPTYRDILVFKKDNRIIGFAKVCFQCSQNYIVVDKVIEEDIDLDYEDLKNILDELASS